MAPEQALATKFADARSDIYSLGCSLFYLLIGRSIYSGDSPMQRLISHREEPIPSLRQQRGDVPEHLQQIFEKMVAKRPENRFQKKSDVVRELEDCLREIRSGVTVSSPRTGTRFSLPERSRMEWKGPISMETTAPTRSGWSEPVGHEYFRSFFTTGHATPLSDYR